MHGLCVLLFCLQQDKDSVSSPGDHRGVHTSHSQFNEESEMQLQGEIPENVFTYSSVQKHFFVLVVVVGGW